VSGLAQELDALSIHFALMPSTERSLSTVFTQVQWANPSIAADERSETPAVDHHDFDFSIPAILEGIRNLVSAMNDQCGVDFGQRGPPITEPGKSKGIEELVGPPSPDVSLPAAALSG